MLSSRLCLVRLNGLFQLTKCCTDILSEDSAGYDAAVPHQLDQPNCDVAKHHDIGGRFAPKRYQHRRLIVLIIDTCFLTSAEVFLHRRSMRSD